MIQLDRMSNTAFYQIQERFPLGQDSDMEPTHHLGISQYTVYKREKDISMMVICFANALPHMKQDTNNIKLTPLVATHFIGGIVYASTAVSGKARTAVLRGYSDIAALMM